MSPLSFSCNPLPPSLAALDLPLAMPAPVLASIRFLVLTHLAELEGRLSTCEASLAETLVSRGEGAVEEARAWANEALEMLGRIRDDVSSHLPELPFDPIKVEETLKAHLHDLSHSAFVDDIRSRLPELSDVQSRIQDVRSHLPDMSIDLNQPFKYLPTLNTHLQTLNAHLSSMRANSTYSLLSLPSTATISEILERLSTSNMIPNVLQRMDGQERTLEKAVEKAAREITTYTRALKQSLDGARLVTYVDLPVEWQSNPFVTRGYRYARPHYCPN